MNFSRDPDSEPQDIYKSLVYTVDENGNYIKTQILGWEPQNIAHSLAWDTIKKRVNDVKNDVLAGRLSPLAFYMERSMMSPGRLSGLIGIPKWRIKRHLKPSTFNKMSDKYRNRYAEFFNVSISDFINIKTEES